MKTKDYWHNNLYIQTISHLVMPDLQKVVQDKERIMSMIKTDGPSFPGRIASQIKMSSLFVSALLSELVSEKKLKISNMKIGSSPIYLIPGQEENLEKFTTHLNFKEKEAHDLLKKEKLLEDSKQHPAIRVALKKLKDFAIPVKINIDKETKLFWRYFSFPENEIKNKIQENIHPTSEKIVQETNPKKEYQTSKQNIIGKKIISSTQPQTKSEFSDAIKDYLKAKDIEIMDELSIKKREFISKVRTDVLFGKQEYLLVAKDKKKVNEKDLTTALEKGTEEKMPSLFISPGE